MVPVQIHKPQAPTHHRPEAVEPGTPPVDPDEGLVPAFVPTTQRANASSTRWPPSLVRPTSLPRRDIDAGMVDTDMRATPGLDAGLHACRIN